uniref:Uncharacterized protein n=1 Tax=Nelumbo nucifera TaxID=4432 RepID=A0A822Y9T2_NELNU|nr:TPA_asm: hypothetical protein HUJ06_027806 [Nelumbo nucifera]
MHGPSANDAERGPNLKGPTPLSNSGIAKGAMAHEPVAVACSLCQSRVSPVYADLNPEILIGMLCPNFRPVSTASSSLPLPLWSVSVQNPEWQSQQSKHLHTIHSNKGCFQQLMKLCPIHGGDVLWDVVGRRCELVPNCHASPSRIPNSSS